MSGITHRVIIHKKKEKKIKEIYFGEKITHASQSSTG